MGKGHFIFQCVLIAIWMFLLIEPIYALFFAVIVGGVQVFHSVILISTTKIIIIKRHIIYYYLGIVFLGMLFFLGNIYFERDLIMLSIFPIILAIYFLIITKLVYNKTNDIIKDKDINDFLKPNNNVEE